MKFYALASCAAMFALPMLTTAHAEDQPKIDCTNGGASTVEEGYCAEQDYDKADKQLNAVYKQAGKASAALDKDDGLTPATGAVQSLKTAQRVWIQYRDAHCDTVGYEAHGGTILGTLLTNCKTGMTNDRIRQLKDLIKGMEN
jgi:uncharacterized protein YecT (DUF1311 family)